MKKLSYLLVITLLGIFISGCGNSDDGVKVSKTGELLMEYSWKLQPNESLDASSDSLKDNTNIDADIELKGDVKKIADFIAETLVFDRDKDKTKLAYSSTLGKGFLSIKTVGFWELADDDVTLTLKEWDDTEGKALDGVEYTIVEISKERLVLENKSTGGIKIYFPLD